MTAASRASMTQIVQGVTPSGLTIANQASTTVTSAAPYWQVERTTGGGAYDAAAVSASGYTGLHLITINRTLGTFFAGCSSNPAASNGFGDLVGFLSDGANNFVYSFGSQVSGTLANDAWMFIRWDTGVDQNMRFYSGATSTFGSATLRHTLDLTGFSATVWKFDSSLNTAGAKFLANMVNA